jgi:hypothetical protein
MRLVSLTIIWLIVFSMCLFSYVAPARAVDPTLTDIFNQLDFTNLAQITMETFPAGRYNITLYAQFAEHISENELSFYQINTSTFNVIFTPSEGGSEYISPPMTKTFQADYQFGLSLLSWQQTRYFSETSLNPDGQPHVQVYQNLNDPNMLLIGYDERTVCDKTGDKDFNDMVFSLQLEHYLRVISPYDTPNGEGWYYNGTNAFATLADSIVDHGNGTRRAFTQWNGDAHGTNYAKSDPIFMNQNKTATATWKTQHYLTVKTDPTGLATIPGQGWCDQGQGVSLTAPSVSGYAIDYWDVDGVSQGKGVNPMTISMNAPHTATAHYAQAFTLTIETTTGGTTNPVPGNYFENPGSTVQVTAVPSTDYALDYWLLDGTNKGSTNPYTVTMDKNHTLRAVFRSSPPLVVSIDPMSKTIFLGQTVTFTSTVSGGTGPYSYQWYLDGSPFAGATSNTWTFLPVTVGTYSVKLKVTDSASKTAESDTATVLVKLGQVGGYSVPMKGQSAAKPLAIYLALFALSTIVFTRVKRKRSH